MFAIHDPEFAPAEALQRGDGQPDAEQFRLRRAGRKICITRIDRDLNAQASRRIIDVSPPVGKVESEEKWFGSQADFAVLMSFIR